MNNVLSLDEKFFPNGLRFFSGLFLLVIFSFFLNSCSTTPTRDGPPKFYVDASRIPDAVPQSEPISKYGNYHRYVVWGKVYHTLPTAKGYEEIGVASWYGTKFHKHHTSSGERYDMLGMTAAHKTLPLPTYVQVTNLKNGRKVIVKVNDRGPFSGHRLIDLSYVAAMKLGMLGHGTTLVDVKAIDPIAYAARGEKYEPIHLASAIGHTIHREHYDRHGRNIDKYIYLQVGAFHNRQNAEKLKLRVAQMTPSPVSVTLLHHANRHLYHVRIGPLRNFDAAHHLTEELKTIGLSSSLA